LRTKAQFEAVYARGRRFGDGYFAVIVHRDGNARRPRLGLAVAVKIAGSSVRRNSIRRIIRESFRLRQHDLPAVDVVVSARPRARAATSAELRASLEGLWDKVRAQCGSSNLSTER